MVTLLPRRNHKCQARSLHVNTGKREPQSSWVSGAGRMTQEAQDGSGEASRHCEEDCVLGLGPGGGRRGGDGEIRSGLVPLSPLLNPQPLASSQSAQGRDGVPAQPGEAGEAARTLASSAASWGCSPTTTPAGRARRPSHCCPRRKASSLRASPSTSGAPGSARGPQDSEAWKMRGEEAFKSAALYGGRATTVPPRRRSAPPPWRSH